MNPSMINARTTMSALQQKLDIMANNMANMQTTGYKRQDISFHDVLTSHKQQSPYKAQPQRMTPMGLTLSWGAKPSLQQIDFSQGSLLQTDLPTDLAIQGNGLFEINVVRRDETGQPIVDDAGMPLYERLWTRNGAFQLAVLPDDNEHGYLATQDGTLLRSVNGELIAIPNGFDMQINRNGQVFIYREHRPDIPPERVGQLAIVQVDRPEVLENMGEGLYRMPDDVVDIDGVLRMIDDLESVGISIQQGFLEQSNVNLAEEMVELMSLQRAYQFNARALISSDAMMGMALQLRG